MDNATFFTVTSLVRLVIWGFLAVNISRHKLHRSYPLATLYIAFAATAFLVRIISAAAIGTGWPYTHIYLWSAIPAHALAYTILLQFYALPQKLSKKDLHLVLAIPITVVIESLTPWNYHLIPRILNVLFLYQSYLALSAVTRLYTKGATIERGSGAIIAALLFPAAARSSIYALYLYDPKIWTYSFPNIGLELVDLASWAILAAGLREQPGATFQRVERTDANQSRQQMRSFIKALWRKA